MKLFINLLFILFVISKSVNANDNDVSTWLKNEIDYIINAYTNWDNPPEIVGKDLSQVAKNNDLYKEVCKEHKSVADKMKAKAERIIDKPWWQPRSNTMAKSMALGGGGRFAKLARKTGSKRLAAWIGRKKHGKKKMASMSAKGRKRVSSKRKKRKA